MNAYSGQVPDTRPAADWRNAALCRTEDPAIFFASEGTDHGKADVRHAKVICWQCPSLQACGQWALESREAFGVWGGMSEADRRAILRRRGIRLIGDPDGAEGAAV